MGEFYGCYNTSGRVRKEIDWARGRTRIKRMRFIKSDNPRDPHPKSNRVVAAVTLVLHTVPKENTLD